MRKRLHFFLTSRDTVRSCRESKPSDRDGAYDTTSETPRTPVGFRLVLDGSGRNHGSVAMSNYDGFISLIQKREKLVMEGLDVVDGGCVGGDVSVTAGHEGDTEYCVTLGLQWGNDAAVVCRPVESARDDDNEGFGI